MNINLYFLLFLKQLDDLKVKLKRLEEENELLTLQVKNSNLQSDDSLNEVKNRVKQDYKSIIELVLSNFFFFLKIF